MDNCHSPCRDSNHDTVDTPWNTCSYGWLLLSALRPIYNRYSNSSSGSAIPPAGLKNIRSRSCSLGAYTEHRTDEVAGVSGLHQLHDWYLEHGSVHWLLSVVGHWIDCNLIQRSALLIFGCHTAEFVNTVVTRVIAKCISTAKSTLLCAIKNAKNIMNGLHDA